MEDKLIELLESLGVEVHRQGSLAENKPYPETFFTYWENDSYDLKHYDNKTFSVADAYTIYIYSKRPKTAYDLLTSAIALLKENGWIVSGRGYDVDSGTETHTGRAIDITYLSCNV